MSGQGRPDHVEPDHVEPDHVEPDHVEPDHVEPDHAEPDHDWLVRQFGLAGRRAVVTGGTRGIGFMVAEGLLRAGASVTLCARTEADCGSAVTALSAYGEVVGVPADLSTEQGCADLAARVAEDHDRLDVLVNNAGAAWGAPIEDYPESGWDKVMDLNVKATFMLTRHLLPVLAAAGTADEPARVINIGSIDGLVVPGVPNFAYSASKAAVHHLTRVLARELAPRHVLVNAIAPGPFESKMTARLLAEHGAEVTASSPLQRIGRASDMAAAAIYLAGRGSGYVTGAVLPVDGGIATTLSPTWTGDA